MDCAAVLIAHVFVMRVCDGFVRREHARSVEVELAFVRMQPRLARNVFGDDLLDCLLVGHWNMERADTAAALDKRHDGARVLCPHLVRTALPFAARRYARCLGLAV